MRTAPTTSPPSHGEPASTRDEIRKLSSLVDISQALSGTLNLRAGLHRALEILERHHAVVFGLGFGTAYPVFAAYVMEHVDPRRRGAAFGGILAAFDTGIGTGSDRKSVV